MSGNILSWDKPKQKQSVEEWKNQSFDGGPAGGYLPNMSDDDMNKWKAKLIGKTTSSPQVEIRKTIKGTQLLVIVNLGGGYKYGSHDRVPDRWGRSTQGINIHMSMNGAAQMTFQEMEELQQAIGEAKAYLENLKS
jgi:hypothetical protein